VGLTADKGLRGVMLGIERVEVLLEPVLARHAGRTDTIELLLDRLSRSMAKSECSSDRSSGG
jgi:hypothetical protein